ncbi:hypothetical protein B2M27_25270 [Kluyvera intermedia]|uniref:Transcriptional regulator n=1 Tax=Kluyvera intermedia TaxID=61648 RepID=A0ABX3U7R3_KLUIN|nr:hypothetical protein [Kluyvera intermedia]ORJ47560.1 hypothetical protein B2M27_25270 [Kluyvera intermedia]
MRLTKEQLIAAAHAAAKYLPAASADIMKELATRLDVTSVALSESLEQRKKLAKALTVIANSEQHEGDTVVCDFSSLVSVASGALREHYNSECHSDMNEATSNGR